MADRSTTTAVFEKQWLHALALAALLYGADRLARANGMLSGEAWGIGAATWFRWALAIAAAHQILVWFCWRSELHLGWLSRAFGRRGFVLYAVAFSILGISRVAMVYILAFANRDAVALPITGRRVVALLLLVPAVYLFYSVRKYFGFRRAFGIDHFDRSARSLPMVRQGIFRYTRNGMYVFGFLILWVPGIWLASPAALVVALFNHLYIWVHYFATERPDMRRIYGSS